jgi:hypothetical protein
MKDAFIDQHPLWKPKLYAATAVFATGTVALFLHYISGGDWVAASTLTLGVFTTGNIVENKAILAAQ